MHRKTITQHQKYFKCLRHLYQSWLWPSPLFQEKSKNVDYGRTWHLAKVPTMHVSSVWVMTGQRSKECYQEAIRRRLRLSPIRTLQFHKSSNSISPLSHYSFETSSKVLFLLIYYKWQWLKSQLEWRLSIYQIFSNVRDTWYLVKFLLEFCQVNQVCEL